LECTYFYQVVNSFADYRKIYAAEPNYAAPYQEGDIKVIFEKLDMEEDRLFLDRRHRFLDHLIARFAERFHDFAYTLFDLEKTTQLKCAFLKNYPTLSSERSLAYHYTLQDKLWNTENVSGLEKRLASLLGISDYTRRDLSAGEEEGMYLIENILLRPEQEDDPVLPIRTDPNCTDCTELDPYSYRIHIILPVYAGRFKDLDFRRFAEAVIREETPAHILPKICWVSKADMVELQKYYQDWLSLKAGTNTEQRHEKLVNFIKQLFAVRTVYPSQKLSGCEGGDKQFILGQTRLGTDEEGE
jgi:hypothetical protein